MIYKYTFDCAADYGGTCGWANQTISDWMTEKEMLDKRAELLKIWDTVIVK